MDNYDFSVLYERVKEQPIKNVVIANGVDDHSLETVFMALRADIVTATITGDTELIKKNCSLLNEDFSKLDIIHADTEIEAVAAAVNLVSDGKADIIMKGLLSTDKFMKAILHKETGIMSKGSLLSHISFVKNKNYYKPLLVSDVAIIPKPTLEQKKQITHYLINYARKLGIEKPKVAFITATEQIIQKMPSTVEAYQLKQMWEAGEFPDAYCDGPMALDVAIDKESADIKGIHSEVAGNADCLLFPNIESGNIFYKFNTKLCRAETAAVIIGTLVPVVLASRGDSIETKLNSILLAALFG